MPKSTGEIPDEKLKHAYHEASHAVAYRLYDFEVLAVSIKVSVERTGEVVKINHGVTLYGKYLGSGSLGSDEHIKAYISGILAGGIGEEKFTGRKSAGLHQDYALVNKCTENADPAKAHKLLNDIVNELNILIRERDVWGAIAELASLVSERDASDSDVCWLLIKYCPERLARV
jgi:hypothetical protein